MTLLGKTRVVPRCVVALLLGCAARPSDSQSVVPRDEGAEARSSATDAGLFDMSTHFVAELDGFVVVQPPGCKPSRTVERIDVRGTQVELSRHRCQTEALELEIACVESSALAADWQTDLNALLGPRELVVEDLSKLWPETAFHVRRDGDATSKASSGVAFRQPDRACRLLISYAVEENGSTPRDVPRIKASFLSTAAARRALAELPKDSPRAVDATRLRRELSAREVAGGTFYLDRVEHEADLARVRELYGTSPVLLYNLHAKSGPKTYGKTVTIVIPGSKHALLDAFQLERAVPHYDTLVAEEFEFSEGRDGSFGELAEVHAVTSPLSTPELSASATFVRCGVFVNITSWSGDVGGAASQVRAIANDIDEVIRATTCAP